MDAGLQWNHLAAAPSSRLPVITSKKLGKKAETAMDFESDPTDSVLACKYRSAFHS